MKALILVNLQNDFMPGGAMPVRDGNTVIPVANRLMNRFPLVVATQVWHPPDHLSFATQHPGRNAGESIHLAESVQTLCPEHCVRDSEGAMFAEDLDTSRFTHVFRLGARRAIDARSAFFESGDGNSTGLGEFLKDQRVSDLFVLGVPTDHCVKYTVLDAIQLGFFTTVVRDGCRGIDLIPGDSREALAEMVAAGAEIVSSRNARSAIAQGTR